LTIWGIQNAPIRTKHKTVIIEKNEPDAIVWKPDGETFAVVSHGDEGGAEISEKRTLRPGAGVVQLEWNPVKPGVLASGRNRNRRGHLGEVIIWNVHREKGKEEVHRFKPFEEEDNRDRMFRKLAWSRDGGRLICVGLTNVNTYDTGTWERIGTFVVPNTTLLVQTAISPDETRLVTGGPSGTLRAGSSYK